MTVYVLTDCYGQIISIYSSREKAEADLQYMQHSIVWKASCVTEWEVEE